MRRLALLCLLIVAGLPAGAGATATRCTGFAPADHGCAFSAIAQARLVDGMLTSDTFVGIAEYAVQGPGGMITASCYAYPGVTTCYPSARGAFAPGETVTVAVSVTGAGSWAFTLLH